LSDQITIKRVTPPEGGQGSYKEVIMKLLITKVATSENRYSDADNTVANQKSTSKDADYFDDLITNRSLE